MYYMMFIHAKKKFALECLHLHFSLFYLCIQQKILEMLASTIIQNIFRLYSIVFF